MAKTVILVLAVGILWAGVSAWLGLPSEGVFIGGMVLGGATAWVGLRVWWQG